MPDIFEEIARENGKNVYVEACTKGKATIEIQSNRKEVYASIRSRKWDVIVIQGSSRDMIHEKSYIEENTIPALERILEEVDKHCPKAKKLFYMTWGYRNGYKPEERTNTFKKMVHVVRDGYLSLKERFGIGVVPVGEAWEYIRSSRQDVNLYVKDGAHPSLKGSYLAACCFYAGIFGETPVGTKYYSKLGPKICSYLQNVADAKVLKQKRKFGLPALNV